MRSASCGAVEQQNMLSPSSSSLQIQRFGEIPSAEEFASQIEPKNFPAVFTGCIKNWKAFSKWNPANGGLDYLQETVGSSNVEVMLSQSAPVFYGDIRRHERVSLPFATFIGYCKDVFHNESSYGEDSFIGSKSQLSTESQIQQSDCPQQFYLAQVPIINIEPSEKIQLEILKADIEEPPFLNRKSLTSVNLWMNSAQTRSSTHYDPHHNLLCIVTGCKQVVLWPPSASPLLYPLPIYGEASNHSAIALENPNFSVYPRAECSKKYSQKVILHAGDALFIPEGWYHQVDSERLTTAINYWWRSNLMSGLLEHMDSYYLRSILKRLVDREMNQMLHLPSITINLAGANGDGSENNGNADTGDQHLEYDTAQKCSEDNKLKQRIMLHELDPSALQSLHELVALVHERVDPSQTVDSSPANNLVVGEKDGTDKTLETDLFHLKDDPIANVLWTLQPHALQHIFLAMAHNFPRTLEALILHALSPVGAEVLTRKFEQMDQLIGKEDRNQFYQIFYAVFDDQFVAMDVLLNGKESFARKAFKNVLDQYLGIDFDGSKPSLRDLVTTFV